MKHRVTSSTSLIKMLPPLIDGTHPFGYHSQDRQPIKWEVNILVLTDRRNVAIRRQRNQSIRIQDRCASLDFEDRIDVEIAVSTLDSVAWTIATIFNPVYKCTCMGYW
jgi:hypothetical protein